MPTIRAFERADFDALRDICIRTGANGTDATGTTIDDGLLPDRFASPYAEYAPEFAFVVDGDGDGGEGDPDDVGGDHVPLRGVTRVAAGYVLAVPDTTAFVRWYREHWMPLLAQRYAHLHPEKSDVPLVRGAFSPEGMLIDGLDDYPAHLHIDLLPSLQGRGCGRALIERECAALAHAGVPGVHLGVSAANANALAFYPRVGFSRLDDEDSETVLFGRRL